MISHVPGPFELLILRLKARVGDWMDRRFVLPARLEVVESTNQVKPVQNAAPKAVQEIAPVVVAEPEPTPPKQRSKARARRPVKPVQKDLPRTIARAINDGRASGSQRDLARTFNVSKTTVVRAQRLARELAEMH